MPAQQFSWMGASKTTTEVLETALMRETSETAGIVQKRRPKSSKEKRAAILSEAKRVLRSLNSDEESDVDENGEYAAADNNGNAAPNAAASSGKDDETSGAPSFTTKKWESLRKKLPFAKDEKDRRDALFKQFDNNDNGFLSLAEVDKGARDILSLHTLTNGLAPILMRAHTKARSAATQNGDSSVDNADFVQKFEFRWLLLYIFNYFELWSIFDSMDIDKDRRVSIDEFRRAVPLLESWGVAVGDDVEGTFATMDSNGGGLVLFEEFCDWAFQNHPDVKDASE
jgi:Ca2+-binding EF-hand superfamily protein